MLDGKATFEIDGETVDAPRGTLVFVQPESWRKATGDGPSSSSAPPPARRITGLNSNHAAPNSGPLAVVATERQIAVATSPLQPGQ